MKLRLTYHEDVLTNVDIQHRTSSYIAKYTIDTGPEKAELKVTVTALLYIFCMTENACTPLTLPLVKAKN